MKSIYDNIVKRETNQVMELLWGEMDKREDYPYRRFEQSTYQPKLKKALEGSIFIEVGGPTADYFGFPFLNLLKADGRLIVSNRNLEFKAAEIGLLLDAKDMPIKDASVDVLCASYLNCSTLLPFAECALRILSENGLLVIQGLTRYYIEEIKHMEFLIEKSHLQYGYGVAFSRKG